MNGIKVGDRLKTGDGQDVEITSVIHDDENLYYPIYGLINGHPLVWTKEGKYYRGVNTSNLDLIIPDQPEETASQYIGHVTEVEIINGTDLSAKVAVVNEFAAKVEIKTYVNVSEWPALSAAILAALKSMNLEGDK